jgi:hypothetical protein
MQLGAVFIATVCTILPAATCGCSDAVGTHGSSDHAPAKARVAVGDASPQTNRPVGAGVEVPQTQAVRTSRRSALAEFLWNPPPEEVARYRVTYGALVLGVYSADLWSELATNAESVKGPLEWASAYVHAGYNTGTITEEGLVKRAKAGGGKVLRPIMPAPPLIVLVIYCTTDEIGMLTNVSAEALKDEDAPSGDVIEGHEPLGEVRSVRIRFGAHESHDSPGYSIAPLALKGPDRIRALAPGDSWDAWFFTIVRSQQAQSDVTMMGRNVDNRDDPDGIEVGAALRTMLAAARKIERHATASAATQPE